MRLAGSLPMTNVEEYEGEPEWIETEEGIRRAMAEYGAGKILLSSDAESCRVFSSAACSPRAVSVVFDGDCLPFFSMPDGVSCVIAAGGRDVLLAARYFAEVRGIGCVLFPSEASLDGAYDRRALVRLGGEETPVSLSVTRVCCDPVRLRPTLAEGYGRLLLSLLANFEARALFRFGAGKEEREDKPDLSADGENIIRENARLRRAERDGAPAGEGIVLKELLAQAGEPLPAWRAFLQLSSLYAAFFSKGKPRRYFTPDYRARAERAGIPYPPPGIPTAEEYAVRAMALERERAPLAREILALAEEKDQFLAAMREFSPTADARGGDLSLLRTLPERGGGLSAIIRDFGLMEWE